MKLWHMLSQERIRLARSKIHGLGVFANKNFRTGQTVEVCPCIIVSDAELADQTELSNYAHFMEHKKDEYAIVTLGFGSLYNHSNKPNAEWEELEKEDRIFIVMKTIKPIRVDEEITIYYSEYYEELLEYGHLLQ